MKNIAEKIAQQFDYDGMCFETETGVNLDAVCAKQACSIEHADGGSIVRFTFSDASILTIAGDGWDFGHSCCFSWFGGDHEYTCENYPQ